MRSPQPGAAPHLVFSDDDEFYRRIPSWHFDFPNSRIFSQAFRKQRLSVNWAARSSADETLKDHEEFGVASITAGVCYREEQTIEYLQ